MNSDTIIHLAEAGFTLLVVLMGVAATWGALRKGSENQEKRDAANDKAHAYYDRLLRNHEGRLSWCEAKVNGQRPERWSSEE